MNVLILSVTAGGGHYSTAKALEKEFLSAGVNVTVVDMYYYANKLMFRALDKGYLISTKYLKKPFRSAYTRLEQKSIYGKTYASVISAKSLVMRKLSAYFHRHKFDAVICTHVFAAIVMDELKERGIVQMPVIGIITDYCIHPFWEETVNIDYIVTASELLNYTAILRGINSKRLLPLGIPVLSKFRKRVPKEEARRKLKMDPWKKTLLFMSGSMGYGNMINIVSSIDRMNMDFQIICICGNNKKMYNRMQMLKTKNNMLVYGFVNNVDEYMDAADCILTKPGGLTVSECLAKSKPMILLNPIPGQEERNTEFLLNNGVAVKVSSSFSAAEAVNFIFNSPGRLELMEKSAKLITHPDAGEKLCEFIIELVKRTRSKGM